MQCQSKWYVALQPIYIIIPEKLTFGSIHWFLSGVWGTAYLLDIPFSHTNSIGMYFLTLRPRIGGKLLKYRIARVS